MVKKISEVFVTSVIIAVVAFLFFRIIGGIPFSVSQVTTNKMSTFDVSGEGRIHVVPDRAMVVLGVRKTASQVKTAQDLANGVMNTVMADLKKLGVEDKDIKTTGYNIYPNYEGPTGRPSGFVVSTEAQVRIRNFVNIPAALDLAGTYGLEQVGQLSFILSDELKDKSLDQAREIAVREAKKKAGSLSDLAGVRLGKIVNVSEGYGGMPEPRLYNALNVTEQSAAKDMAVVNPGTSEVQITVTLSYETL